MNVKQLGALKRGWSVVRQAAFSNGAQREAILTKDGDTSVLKFSRGTLNICYKMTQSQIL